VDTHNKGVVERGTSIGITFTYKNPSMMPIWPYLAGSGATSATFVESGSGTTHKLTGTLADNGLPQYVAGFGTRDFYASCETMPNYVTKGTLSWGLYFSDGFSTYYTMPNQTIYHLEDAPVDLQIFPWTEVLDDATNFAQGESGKFIVRQHLTEGLFCSKSFSYQTNVRWVYVDEDVEPAIFWYELTDLLNHRHSQGTPVGNCVDVSAYLLILMNSVGIEGSLEQYTHNTFLGGRAPFLTNDLCSIGSDWTDSSSYDPIVWDMHQVTVGASGSYDASLALDRNLDGTLCSWPQTSVDACDYWQTAVGTSPTTYYGVCKRLIKPSDSPVINYSAPSEPVTANLTTFSITMVR
jgi:hypothetical protein